jgi:hypothetical protein
MGVMSKRLSVVVVADRDFASEKWTDIDVHRRSKH